MYKKYIKRLLDLILSLIAFVVLLPLMAVLAVSVAIAIGFPIFFRQKRVGKDEKIFMMYKFRTMTNDRDYNGNLLPDSERLTKLGKFLRGSSLDELPQLFNAIRGDISIVGPRSLIPEYLPYYTEYERQRHKVRGGLTVPEVLYDNFTPTWDEQLRYEADYANNVNFLTDVMIIFKTIAILFKRNDADYGKYVRESLIKEREQNEK